MSFCFLGRDRINSIFDKYFSISIVLTLFLFKLNNFAVYANKYFFDQIR
ncbi:hypothetical protein LMANV2_90122 [Leptospira interrogans serovar Manilae]|uniref:Uncharacterized protein n=1 Tax=Leptospira interrogans serovar Manilae TaxID=214675 RepID=A0AAQ1SR07_LEPIR|nr:hypothetical protein LMANV2_90122 [Leptospira interrogans serovar Manilae]